MDEDRALSQIDHKIIDGKRIAAAKLQKEHYEVQFGKQTPLAGA